MASFGLTLNPSLHQLQVMKVRGALRKALRTLCSVHGVVAVAIVVGYLYLLLNIKNDQVMSMFGLIRKVAAQHGGPVVLLVLLSTLSSGLAPQGLGLDAAENQFVLAGPFSDRELLAYRLRKQAAGTLWSSALMSLVLGAVFGGTIDLFLRVFALFLFLSWASPALAAGSQRLSESTRNGLRQVLRILVSGVLAVCALAFAGFVLDFGRTEAVELFNSNLYHLALGPFAEINSILFRSGRDLSVEILVAASVAAIFSASMALRFLDIRSDEAVAQTHEDAIKADLIRRKGLTLKRFRRFETDFRDFPWFGGAGPMLWRKCQEHSRHVPYILGVLVFALGLHGYFAGSSLQQRIAMGKVKPDNYAFWEAQVFALAAAFFVARNDFGADICRLEYLKSLPLKTTQVVLGQVLISSAYIFFITVLLDLVSFIVERHYFPGHGFGPVLMAFLIWGAPLSLLSSCLANSIFLLFPVHGAERKAAIGFFQFIGAYAVIIGYVALLAVVAWSAELVDNHFGRTGVLYVLLSIVAYTGAATVAFHFTDRCYRRFDISRIR